MILKPAAVAAIGLACVWGQSYAQETSLPHLVGLQSAVLVDHGDGFVQAAPGTPFQGGDRVTTAHGGFAKISYADGCSVDVDSRTIATIDSASPCDGGPSPQMLQMADDTTVGGGSGNGGYGGIGPTGLIIGGVAILGVGLAAGIIIGEDQKHTVVINGGGGGNPGGVGSTSP